METQNFEFYRNSNGNNSGAEISQKVSKYSTVNIDFGRL